MAKKNSNKIIFKNFQSPGDIVMLAYGIKALGEQYGKKYTIDVRTPCPEIFEGNPYITPLDEHDPDVRTINIGYPTIHRSNQAPVHFVNSFVHEIGRLLEIKLEPTDWNGAIFIREQEKWWFSAPREIIGRDVPYVVADFGHKKDFTIKAWGYDRYQEIVDRNPDIWFVQIGVNHEYHYHPEIKGKNLINLVGKTDNRQLIRLIYNAFGVLTPVSFPMVLAYAVPPHPRFGRRWCVVTAGAREPNMWQNGPSHTFLHSCGMLSCCANGACWKSRVVPIGDGDEKDTNLCLKPIQLQTGQWIAKCMDMITVDEVHNAIRKYQDNLEYEPKY